MKKVLVTRRLDPKVLSDLENTYKLDIWESADIAMPRNELLQRAAGSHAILCMLTDKIDEELVNAAGEQLKVVSTMSVGYDHVDVEILKQRGIRLGYTPDVLTNSVADTTVALMLAASRRIPEAIAAAKEGDWGTWAPYWMTGQDLSESTIGIVGLGAIGIEVARRLTGFRCKLLYTGRTRKEVIEQELGIEYVTQDDLLRRSDFVSIHSALNSETVGLCNEEFFSKMKQTAVFINTSRGGLVDQDALFEALVSNSIYGAGLDVTVPEPLPVDDPLFNLKNCVIFPHIGSASIKTRDAMTRIAVANTDLALKDEKMQYEVGI